MSVREIVERAGARLPSKSKTPDTVVARDLSMDIKKKGETSLFIRTSPGRYTLRALATGVTPMTNVVAATTPAATVPSAPATAHGGAAPQPMSALATRKPAAPAPSTTSASTARPSVTAAASGGDGGGYAS
jgi:hypothetical protein